MYFLPLLSAQVSKFRALAWHLEPSFPPVMMRRPQLVVCLFVSRDTKKENLFFPLSSLDMEAMERSVTYVQLSGGKKKEVVKTRIFPSKCGKKVRTLFPRFFLVFPHLHWCFSSVSAEIWFCLSFSGKRITRGRGTNEGNNVRILSFRSGGEGRRKGCCLQVNGG